MHGTAIVESEMVGIHWTRLSIGKPGIDVVDNLYRSYRKNIDYVVCLNDQNRLLESPVDAKVWSENMTIFNTARALLPLLNYQRASVIVGPDARDLRIFLALTELERGAAGPRIAFVIGPDNPTGEWAALLSELSRRVNRMLLFEPASYPVRPMRWRSY